MEEQKERCWSCLQYNVFYVKAGCHFRKKKGYCHYHKKIVDEQETCEQWVNGLISKKIRKRRITELLTQIMHKLTMIEQVIKDDINVNEL